MKQKKRRLHPSLQNRLILSFIVAALFPVLSITLVFFLNVSLRLEEDIVQRNELLSKQLSLYIEQYLNKPELILQEVQDMVTTENLIDPARINEYLEIATESAGFFETIRILDRQGNVINLAPFDENILGLNMSHTPYYKEAQESGFTAWSDTFISPQTGKITILLALPYREGMITGNIDLTDLSLITDRIKLGQNGSASICDSAGYMIAHRDRMLVSQRINLGHLPHIKGGLFGVEGTYDFTFDGEERIGSVSIIHPVGWLASVVQPRSEAYDANRQLLRIFSIVLVSAIFAAALLSIINIRHIMKPLYQLTAEAIRIREGDNTFLNTLESFREINMLSDSFRSMITTIRDREASLVNEIEEHRKTDEALGKSRERYKLLFERSYNAIFIVDTDSGRYLEANAAAETLTGRSREELLQMKTSEVSPKGAEERLRIYKEGEKPSKMGEVAYERPDGTVRIAELNAIPIDKNTMIVIARDITEYRKTQEMILQNEKMMSVGGLAAGMAHEINNPLGGIIQTAGVMANRLSNLTLPANQEAADRAGTTIDSVYAYMEDRGIMDMLERIDVSGKRAAEIVHNMLSFSRLDESIMSSHSLPELMDRCIDLAGSDYDLKKKYDFKHINIFRDYEEDLTPVVCEAGKIQQVLLNLLRNAAEAMFDHNVNSPRISIAIRKEPAKEMIHLSLADNGPGMSEEVRRRVFEPFFTTKSVDSGTGLGLSVSYFIIADTHQGEMDVESSPGNGAVFHIRLPYTH